MFVHQPLTRASNALPLIDVTHKGYETLVSGYATVTLLAIDRVTYIFTLASVFDRDQNVIALYLVM